jgi:hypothetical protein
MNTRDSDSNRLFNTFIFDIECYGRFKRERSLGCGVVGSQIEMEGHFRRARKAFSVLPCNVPVARLPVEASLLKYSIMIILTVWRLF